MPLRFLQRHADRWLTFFARDKHLRRALFDTAFLNDIHREQPP